MSHNTHTHTHTYQDQGFGLPYGALSMSLPVFVGDGVYFALFPLSVSV